MKNKSKMKNKDQLKNESEMKNEDKLKNESEVKNWCELKKSGSKVSEEVDLVELCECDSVWERYVSTDIQTKNAFQKKRITC